jgi:hypothetical protein
MSGVSRRPLWACQFICALTAAAPATVFCVSTGHGVPVERVSHNSNSNIFGNLDVTCFDKFLAILIAATAIAGAPERRERLVHCIFKWKEERLTH